MSEPSNSITIALARCAIAFANKHRRDGEVIAVLHQVLRLANSYRDEGNIKDAEALDAMLSWYEGRREGMDLEPRVISSSMEDKTNVRS